MADSIGGSSLHSFWCIPSEDKRDAITQSGSSSEMSGSIFTDEEYHELRFLLLDEVESAGVTLFGRLEESLRLSVPRASSTEALQGRQHCLS